MDFNSQKRPRLAAGLSATAPPISTRIDQSEDDNLRRKVRIKPIPCGSHRSGNVFQSSKSPSGAQKNLRHGGTNDGRRSGSCAQNPILHQDCQCHGHIGTQRHNCTHRCSRDDYAVAGHGHENSARTNPPNYSCSTSPRQQANRGIPPPAAQQGRIVKLVQKPRNIAQFRPTLAYDPSEPMDMD